MPATTTLTYGFFKYFEYKVEAAFNATQNNILIAPQAAAITAIFNPLIIVSSGIFVT